MAKGSWTHPAKDQFGPDLENGFIPDHLGGKAFFDIKIRIWYNLFQLRVGLRGYSKEEIMSLPLVEQLRFTRSEFVRGLSEVSDPEAQQRFGAMNCISWIVGHLAWQEQRYWLQRAQGKILFPELNELLAYGKPACTPASQDMWEKWRQVTQESDQWLDELSYERLQAPLSLGLSSAGTFMMRVIYHYWYHLGEGLAIRQMLGHERLPDFVGDIDSQAPYRPDGAAALAQPVTAAHFLTEVKAARERWDALLAKIPEEQMSEPDAMGGWSVKDIIAHITWHERQMIPVLESRVFGGSELWGLPLDQRNQAIFEENKDRSLESVLNEARETYSRLITELERLEDADLYDPARFSGMPEDWSPIQILVDNTALHYDDHYLALQKGGSG
jgi:uncharacterized protein (TIGR03083 family)